MGRFSRHSTDFGKRAVRWDRWDPRQCGRQSKKLRPGWIGYRTTGIFLEARQQNRPRLLYQDKETGMAFHWSAEEVHPAQLRWATAATPASLPAVGLVAIIADQFSSADAGPMVSDCASHYRNSSRLRNARYCGGVTTFLDVLGNQRINLRRTRIRAGSGRCAHASSIQPL